MKLTIQIDTAGDKLDRSIMHARRILGLLDDLIERQPTDTEGDETRWAVAGEVDPLPPLPTESLAAKPIRFAIADETDKFPHIESVRLEPPVLDPDGYKPTLAESMADACGFERPVPDAPRKNPSGPITGIDAADPFKVATEDPAEPLSVATADPTRLVVEIPADMHPLPDLPEGYSRWVGRGEGWGTPGIKAGNRVVYWFNRSERSWQPTSLFSAYTCFHIEAVEDEAPALTFGQQAAADLRAALSDPEPAPVDQPAEKPRLIPEPGNYYFTRHGRQARIDRKSDTAISGAVFIDNEWLPFHWRHDGEPYGTGCPEWDCVQLAPF